MFLSAAYDHLGMPLYVSDINSHEIIYANPKAQEMFGDICGKKCYEVLGGSDDTCQGCVCAETLIKSGPIHTKARYLKKPDKYIDTYESIVTLPDGASARLCLINDVSAQMQMHRESEAKARSQKAMRYLLDIQSGFVNSAKSMMSAATPDSRLIFVNEVMSEALGYTQEEIRKMHIEDFYSDATGQRIVKACIPQAMKEGSWRGDVNMRRKDGSVFPTRQIIFPIKNQAGEIIAMATIIDDITKVREMEIMNRYQIAIMDSANSYISVADMNKKVIYNSPGAYRMMGYDPDEDDNLPIENVHTPQYSARVLEEGIPTAMTKGQWSGRGELINRYGKYIPIEQTIFPVYDDEKQVMGVATIIEDITEKVEHEKQIEDTRRMLRTIIDTAPSAIFWKDRNSRFLGVNKRFATDAGFDDPEKMIGLSDYDVYPQDIAAIYVAGDRNTFETGNEFFHVEEPFQGSDGATHWVSTSKVLIRDEQGEPYALLGIYDDITRLKQNEESLSRAIEEAKEASRAKSDFLSRMSHEIRTPMNAIIGMTKIGQSAMNMEKMRYCLGKIDSASKHLLGLINDILDMSKIEANKLEMIEEAFDFEKMLEGIYNVINVKAEEKHQTLLVSIDEHIPTEIFGDEMRIAQVITNLLSNAVKFTPDHGTIRLSVHSDGLTADGRLKLTASVADTGIGLSADQMSRLFNSFEQAEAGISRRFGGTGLGLAITKRIVEMMGGTVSVTSKVNQGSTFTFTILVKQSDAAQSNRRDLSVYKDLRVLVVDDARDTLDYFGRVMNNYHIQCDMADNGADAVDLVETGLKTGERYQIMFIDYLMDGMDGIETTRRIKEMTGNSVSVIMVSQTDWTAIEDQARQVGVDRFVQKPLFQSPILDAINQSVLSGKEMTSGGVDSVKGIFAGKRLLLAEDIEINREIVISLLEDTGIAIDCAENGDIALKMFNDSRNHYDLIMMDVQMPVMDGMEATRLIKAQNDKASRDVPIVAITANAFAEDVEACKKAGMIDHLSKPIDFDMLIAKLREYLC